MNNPQQLCSRILAAVPKTAALKLVVLLGLVSLFADMTYEGARSITLAVLGASGTIVGLVAGFGELIGYALRLVSVYLADRTGKYWAITIFGCADDPKQLARLLPHEWTSVIVRILCDRHVLGLE